MAPPPSPRPDRVPPSATLLTLLTLTACGPGDPGSGTVIEELTLDEASALCEESYAHSLGDPRYVAAACRWFAVSGSTDRDLCQYITLRCPTDRALTEDDVRERCRIAEVPACPHTDADLIRCAAANREAVIASSETLSCDHPEDAGELPVLAELPECEQLVADCPDLFQ